MINEKDLKEKFKEYSGIKLTEEERQQVRHVTKHALISLGARVDFAGFDNVCIGVELGLEDPSMLFNVCSKLYPTIAKIVGATKENVERNIRSLIDEISENKSFCGLNNLFDVLIFTIDDKPTAAGLIRLLIEYYLLGLWH